MESNYLSARQAEIDIPQPGLLLRTIHELYRAQFRQWFAIMAPTSLLASLVLVLADMQIKLIFGGFSRSWLQPRTADIALAGVLRFGGFFLSWLLGCFALAAIATIVNHSDHDDDETWRHDSYDRARQRLGPIFVTALITFSAFLAGLTAMQLVQFAATRTVGWARFSRFIYSVSMAEFIVIGTLVSFLGATIPLVVGGNIRVRAALKRSLELASGYEGPLFLLVVESVLGGLIVWYVTLRVLHLLVPDHLKYAAWYGWFVNIVGVLASAAVDPPLFIGLSLLADPGRFKTRLFPGSEQAPDIDHLR